MLFSSYLPISGNDDQFGKGKDLYEYEWRELAEDIERNIPNGRVAVYAIDWGGSKQLDKLRKYLPKRFIVGESLLQDKDDDENEEYRRILTPARDARISDVSHGLVFDDWIGGETGESAIGGLKWLVENSEDLGINKCYLSGMVDFSRMAPFAGRRKYPINDYVGPIEGFRERAPNAFQELYEDGLIRRIGTRRIPLSEGKIPSKLKRGISRITERNTGVIVFNELLDTIK